ncbi:MAG: translocation/assembly module TamB domain-containing protein [Cellvibrionaceae bacterium]|nr:translocation/assembly module TamB domain-containing protein [Cellvibrionaceae bacterium]
MNAAASPPQKSKRKQTTCRSILLKIVVIFLSLSLVLSAVISAALGTVIGREWLANHIAPGLLRSLGIDAKIDGVRWPALGEIHVQSFSISLPSGWIVSVDNGQLEVHTPSLLKRHLLIEHLRLDTVTLLKAPTNAQADSQATVEPLLSAQLSGNMQLWAVGTKPTNWEGVSTWVLAGNYQQLPLHLRAELSLQHKRLHLKQLTATLAEARLEAQAYSDFANSLSPSGIHLQALQLAWGATQLSSQGYIDLTPKASSRLFAELHKLSLAQLRRLHSVPWPALSEWLNTLQTAALEEAELTIEHWQSRLNGSLNAPIIDTRIKAHGQLQQQGATLTTQLHYAADTLRLNTLEVNSGLGKLMVSKGAWHRDTGEVSADLSLTQLHTDAWMNWPFIQAHIPTKTSGHLKTFTAEINAEGRLSGTLTQPALFLSAKALGSYAQQPLTLSLQVEHATDPQALVNAQLRLITEDNIGQPTGAISDHGDQQLTLRAQLPKTAYGLLLNPETRQRSLDTLPLQAQLQGHLNLLPFNKLIHDQSHQIGGQLTLHLEASGTLASPALDGRVQLRQGSYQHAPLGINAHTINMDITAQQQQLRIEKTRIIDQDSGFIDLQGRVNWAEINGHTPDSIDLHISAHQAQLVQRGDIETRFSGDLSLRGNAQAMILKGVIDPRPTAIFLDAMAPDDIAQITVEEVSTDNKASEKIGATDVNLDLSIAAAQQLHVYGKGIDTELGGTLRLLGNHRQPDIRGYFETIRGRFEILGKIFHVDEGHARIENQALTFSLSGIHNTRDGTEITAIINGNLDQLEVQLLANPALPNDDIIAHLLFNKSTGEITPFQAIRLAQALDQLRTGTTSVFDIAGNTRELLGVDSLNLDEIQSDEGETQLKLSIGKYLNDRVYLELEPGFGQGEPLRGAVEIELSPKINLESFSSESSGLEGIELIWKNDY